MKNIVLRDVTIEDAKEILDLYAYYINNTAITYEYDVPSLDEFKHRINSIIETYPYFVATIDNKIVGYAYASSFKARKAYEHSIETSIYVDSNLKGLGIGKVLYAKLEEALIKMNITNVNACIAYTQIEDEYLTNDSVSFHEHLGYKKVGIFHKCAYKFNRWYDMIWMEKFIQDHIDHPKDIIPYKNL